jgi:hypothetical protein
MSDPSLALQIALVKALKDGTVAGGRIYDAIPKDAQFPYVTIGDDQVVGDDVECAEGSEVFVRIHGWSRTVGYTELKRIAAAIRAALRGATLTLSGFVVNEIEFVQTQYLQDPDGLTRHSVTQYRIIITHG